MCVTNFVFDITEDSSKERERVVSLERGSGKGREEKTGTNVKITESFSSFVCCIKRGNPIILASSGITGTYRRVVCV